MNNLCFKCKGAKLYHRGLKGRNADKTKIMFIANRPDQRVKNDKGVFSMFESYELALEGTRTGKNTNDLLKQCGLGWNDIYWTNLFKCVLEKDRVPAYKEYKMCFEHQLRQQIIGFNPGKIVAFGENAYYMMFDENKNFLDAVGNVLNFEERYLTLIMPHPSAMAPPYRKLKEKEELFGKVAAFLEVK